MLELFQTIRLFYLKVSVSLKVIYLWLEIVGYNIILYFVYYILCTYMYVLMILHWLILRIIIRSQAKQRQDRPKNWLPSKQHCFITKVLSIHLLILKKVQAITSSVTMTFMKLSPMLNILVLRRYTHHRTNCFI